MARINVFLPPNIPVGSRAYVDFLTWRDYYEQKLRHEWTRSCVVIPDIEPFHVYCYEQFTKMRDHYEPQLN